MGGTLFRIIFHVPFQPTFPSLLGFLESNGSGTTAKDPREECGTRAEMGALDGTRTTPHQGFRISGETSQA